MSTEPNTQRSIALTIDDCAKQFELYAQSNDGRNIERAHAYRHCSEFLTEFCKQPPPETGAVDVEAEISRIAQEAWTRKEYATADSLRSLRKHVAPLTARISELEKRKDCDCGWAAAAEWEAKANELEKENAALHIQEQRRISQSAEAMADLGAEHSKRLAAEARVKELEAKLEGALKLTTANSIGHVSKLER